jgi:hypothetical protein
MMKSVYCAIRTGDLNKDLWALFMINRVYCAVRTADLNNARDNT